MTTNWDYWQPWDTARFVKSLPVVDEELCNGCALCVEACGPQCLGIDDGLAMLLSAKTCESETRCVAACPEDAIHMQWLPMKGNKKIGKWKAVDQEADA